MVRVEDTEDDLYAAVDLVSDKLKRKLTKVGGWCIGSLVAGGLDAKLVAGLCAAGVAVKCWARPGSLLTCRRRHWQV